MHLTVSRAEISNVMGPAIAEIISTITTQEATITGPCFSYHQKRPTDIFDFEVGFPVSQPITATGRVKMSKLPAVKVVRTIYQGGYEGLGAAWGEFCKWIEAEALNVQESLWERYLTGPMSSPDPDTWRTELNRPLSE
ncbi:GyrI-like domain-containing protein [Methylobacter sp.]|uniref:GyrI-like domain-containing protein n=1 Tax=Methylobacter sp. TaxID=2051955 RepID=UPI002FDDCB6A